MRNVLVVILFFLCFYCCSDQIIFRELTPIKTLPAQTSEYNFSFPVELNMVNDQLHVVDQKTCRIYVFDLELNYLYSFGEYGSSEAQFSRPLSICSNDYDQKIVSDFNNNRLQFLTEDGYFIDELVVASPWKLYYHNQQPYMDVFPGAENAGIYSVSSNGVYPEVDLAKYFDKNDFGSALEKYYSWCVTDWGYVVSFSGRDQVVLFNNSGKAKKTKVEKLPLKYDNTLYGKPENSEYGFFLLATSNNHDQADSTQTEINYHNLLGEYSKHGKIRNLYKLPDNVWLTDSWAIFEQQIFLYDTQDLKIYKFILP